MKKRTISIIVVAIVLLMTVFSGCGKDTGGGSGAGSGGGSGDGKEVKVGFVWPLTGGSSTIGQQHDDGVKMAIDEINANGGIKSMNGAKIVPVVTDSETNPDVGSSRVEQLCTVDDVAIIIGCYNSSVTFPASEVAQRYGKPFLSMGAVKSEITERGYEWVFRINNKATYDVEELLKGLDLAKEKNGIEVKTFGLIYESTDWGSDNAKIFREEAEKRGWKLVSDEAVTVGTSDMSSQVSKIKAANPDVLNVAFYTPEQIVFSKAMTANKVNPPMGIWSTGGGEQDPAYFAGVSPKDYEYNFVQEDWDVSGALNHPWIAELAKKVEAENGYKLNSYFAQGWTAAYVAYEALEAAGSTESEAIRKALVDLDIENSDDTRVILTGYPRIKFDENGQNTYSTGTIIQYQNGVGVGLAPEQNAFPGAKIILPIPNDFDKRAKDSVEWGSLGEWEQ